MVLDALALDASGEDLIVACQRGDTGAFAQLFETDKDRVYSIALRFSGEPATALDIAQDTFVKLLSRIGDFRGEARFDTWLYRMVANSCLDQKRRGLRLRPFVESLMDTLRPARATVLEDLLRAEFAQGVQKVVAKLPAEQRMVVILRYTEGLAYEEIAEILSCSAGTVASRLNRAHKTLERRLSHLKRTARGAPAKSSEKRS
jgi:RNA polymerase sigma-70 factor (ECF subfamily)